MRGLVVKFDAERGFGFIRAPDEGRDIFVHVSEIEGNVPPAPGAEVEFDIEQTAKGPRAHRVRLIKAPSSAAWIFALLGGALAIVFGVLLAPRMHWLAAYLVAVNAATLSLHAYDRAVAQRGLVRIPRATLLLFACIGGAPAALLCRLARRPV